MKVTKGQKVRVVCQRKGVYLAEATADFDTDTDEWYEVKVDQDRPIDGLNNTWYKGDDIPCRRGVATIYIIGVGE